MTDSIPDTKIVSLEKRMEDAERKLPLLEKEFDKSERKFPEIDKRVQNLENKFWVAVTVAVIMGVGGAWGFSLLSSAQTKLGKLQVEMAQLRRGIDEIKTTRDAALEQIRQRGDQVAQDMINKMNATVQNSINAEMTRQIGAVRRWTAHVYQAAVNTGMPRYEGANGWWQKNLIDSNTNAQAELK